MNALSLLQRGAAGCVRHEPFPHLVLNPALPPDLYNHLARTLPSDEQLRCGRQQEANSYHRLTSARLLADANPLGLDERWRAFIRYHVSTAFYAEVLQTFTGAVDSCAAAVTRRFDQPLHRLRAGPRLTARSADYDALLDCQLVHTSPPDRPTRSAGPHVDREVTLWAGLFYLRDPADDSRGGDLLLYRFKDGARPEYWKNRRVPDALVEPVATIPYRANTFVMFLQSPLAVHGVSHRTPTAWGRNYLNLLCEFRFPVFDLTAYRSHLDRLPPDPVAAID